MQSRPGQPDFYADVAKQETQQGENLPVATSWRCKSSHPHHFFLTPAWHTGNLNIAYWLRSKRMNLGGASPRAGTHTFAP